MSVYLSVQLAARRLGVSPDTIRRWTDSGFLPCIRTAGGHRRMRREDVDELATLVAASDQAAARLAREREVDTLVDASVALTSRLDLPELLGEIARRVTATLDCHFCAVSEYDPETDVVSVLADYDRNGQRIADWNPYSLKGFPFTHRLVEVQELGVITVSDPAADPAETAIMRQWGDKTLLVVPLVFAGRTVGTLEVYDHLRERRFTHQELRLARALAGLAAVALQNAGTFARLARSDADGRLLASAVDAVVAGLPELVAGRTVDEVLAAAAALACRALGGASAEAEWDDLTGRARDEGAVARGRWRDTADAAGLVEAEEVTPVGKLVLRVALPRAAGGQEERVLRLVAAAAAQALLRLG